MLSISAGEVLVRGGYGAMGMATWVERSIDSADMCNLQIP
jgi:hypothetical protein